MFCRATTIIDGMTDRKTTALLPLDEARRRMLDSVDVVVQAETLALEDLNGRVLAADIVAPLDSPPADNSAMDGYALCLERGQEAREFAVVGKAMAGAPYTGSISPGQAIRIMTGAEVPSGADRVVMQENAECLDDRLVVARLPERGANIRRAGEDISRGEQVLAAGQRLGPVDIGLLATLGLSEASVWRPLSVALFASGDELRPPGSSLGPGQIYDSNRYFLRAMLERLGCRVIDLGVVADDPGSLRRTYQQAALEAQAVISCGGASVGEADYAQALLAELGQVDFWKVAIKPGKPFIFGRLGAATFFGLPGNPVSALVTCHQLALPVLEKMQGARATEPLTFSARTTVAIRRNRQRLDFQRAVYRPHDQGGFEVTPDRQQSSGALSSFGRCNCFMLLEAGDRDVSAGDAVPILPFDRWVR